MKTSWSRIARFQNTATHLPGTTILKPQNSSNESTSYLDGRDRDAVPTSWPVKRPKLPNSSCHRIEIRATAPSYPGGAPENERRATKPKPCKDSNKGFRLSPKYISARCRQHKALSTTAVSCYLQHQYGIITFSFWPQRGPLLPTTLHSLGGILHLRRLNYLPIHIPGHA